VNNFVFLAALNKEDNIPTRQKRKSFQQLWWAASHLRHNTAVRTVTHTATQQGSKGTSLKTRARAPHKITSGSRCSPVYRRPASHLGKCNMVYRLASQKNHWFHAVVKELHYQLTT